MSGQTPIYALLVYCLTRQNRGWKMAVLSIVIILGCIACVPGLIAWDDYYTWWDPTTRGIPGELVNALPMLAFISGFLPLLWPGISNDRLQGAVLHLTASGPEGVCLARLGTAVISSWYLLALTLPLAVFAARIFLITPLQFAAFYLFTALWMLWVSALALLCSAVAPHRAAATAATVGVIVAVAGVVIGMSLCGAQPWAGIGEVLRSWSIFEILRNIVREGTFKEVLDNGEIVRYGLSPFTFLLACVAYLGSAAALAGFALRTYIRNPDIESATTVPVPPSPPAAVVPTFALSRWLAWTTPPRPPAGPAAIVWKEFHFACLGTFNRWFLPALPIVCIFFGMCRFGFARFDMWLRMLVILAFLEFVAVVGLFLFNAFRDEDLGQTLDDLRVLPLTYGHLLRAKCAGISRAIRPLVFLMLGAFALTLITGDFAFIPDILGARWPLGLVLLVIAVITFWMFCLLPAIDIMLKASGPRPRRGEESGRNPGMAGTRNPEITR